MNWIKSNPFVSGLAGVTILLCGILYSLASKWGDQHDEAKAAFDEAYAAVTKAESLPLYPDDDLANGKSKALTEQRQAITNLSKLFDAYRPNNTSNIDPQAFMDRLLVANTQVVKAFAETELPKGFFLGFEGYRNQLAFSEATGVLIQQMEGIKTALLGLAKSRPTALLSIHRIAAPEEGQGTYQPQPNDLARYLACEITFKGSEQSVREFLNHLGATESHYFIIRTLRITNDRETPPQVKDAKFEDSQAEAAAVAPASPFGDIFDQPAAVETPPAGEPAPPAGEAAPDGLIAPAAGAQPEGEAAPGLVDPEAPPVDTSRILAQVLGKEEVIVFVRFDVALFLPAKELTKP